MGQVLLFKTESPTNHNINAVKDEFEVRVSIREDSAVLSVFRSKTVKLFELSSPDKKKIKGMADSILNSKLGEPVANFITTVSVGEEDCLYTISSGIISIFRKKYKERISLTSIVIDTSEVLINDNKHHQLLMRNNLGQELTISIPDSLLLLQWCGALTSSDEKPVKQDSERSKSSIVLDAVIKEVTGSDDLKIPTDMRGRALSFNLGSKLGPEDVMPKKEDIKKEMLSIDVFPEIQGVSMKEMLTIDVVRRWIYKWSKTQYCAEAVEFIAVYQGLKDLKTNNEKAQAVKKIAQDYIHSEGKSSLNISGVKRKKIMAGVKECGTDEDKLAAMLDSKLIDSVADELYRVLEFDLYPQFVMLVDEVVAERAKNQQADASSNRKGKKKPPTVTIEEEEQISSVRDIAEDESQLAALLLYCSEKHLQDSVLFLTIVAQYKSSDEKRKIAQNIYSNFVEFQSPHFLEYLDEMQASMLKIRLLESIDDPPAALFEGQVNETIAHIDQSKLYGRFLKQQKTAKPIVAPKKGFLGSLRSKNKPANPAAPKLSNIFGNDKEKDGTSGGKGDKDKDKKETKETDVMGGANASRLSDHLIY